MCNTSDYSLYWWHMPPFIGYSEGNSSLVIGIMMRAIQDACAICCNVSQNSSFASVRTVRYHGQEQMLNNLTQERTLAIPVILPSSVAAMKPSEYFIRVAESRGMVHVGKLGKPLTHVLMEAFFAVWPLLAALVVLTGYSAIILWLLHLRDPHRGEGLGSLFDWYWFSFITAATVGYGDKIPSGVTSKIFTMLWAVLGISVMVGTTATLTTLLTQHQESISKLRPLKGEKVGVVMGSVERRFVMQQGGIPEEYYSVEHMLLALSEERIEHLAIDHFSFHHHVKSPLPSSFQYEVIPTPEVTIGYILFAPKEREFFECLRLRSFLTELNIDSELIRNIGHKLIGDDSEPAAILQNAADAIFSNSLKFTLLLLSVICFFLSCLIALCDVFGKLGKCRGQRLLSDRKNKNIESTENDKLSNGENDAKITIPS